MRLIDADALKERKFPNSESEYTVGWNDAISAIMVFRPTIDAEPVRHGKWIDTGKTELNLEDDAELRIFRCSECGLEVSAEKYPHEKAFFLTPFCSNCGARMDG